MWQMRGGNTTRRLFPSRPRRSCPLPVSLRPHAPAASPCSLRQLTACLYVFLFLFSTDFLFCGSVTVLSPPPFPTDARPSSPSRASYHDCETTQNDGARDATRGTTTATAIPHAAQKCRPRHPRSATTVIVTPPRHDNSIHDTTHGATTATATPHAAQRPRPRHHRGTMTAPMTPRAAQRRHL